MKIYHNPRCAKSRQTLALLNSNGVEPEIVLYLKDLLTEEELEALLKKLKMKPSELVRKSEAIYKEQYKGKSITEEKWLSILVKHPKLIERPIVVKARKAVLGRPPENVLELL